MIKFSREALSKTKAGQRIENERQLLLHEKIEEKKKRIAQGYERGWILIGDRALFVRSSWEKNICFYLEYLKQQGQIKEWFYEGKTFYFHKIKRGTNNYKPDFRIIKNDGSEFWIEAKGYFTRKDYVKLNRMRQYYPEVTLKLLSTDSGFERIKNDYPKLKFEKYTSYDFMKSRSAMIKGWDSPFKKKEEVQQYIPLPMKRPKAKPKPKKGDQNFLPF